MLARLFPKLPAHRRRDCVASPPKNPRHVKLRLAQNRVEWDGGHLDLNADALEAIRVDDRILVVHDYMAFPSGPSRNLAPYSTRGDQLWIAENPTTADATDAYVGFVSEDPLWVGNFNGFVCKIDPRNGKILEKKFTK
jgi:predicted small integral membrane protein